MSKPIHIGDGVYVHHNVDTDYLEISANSPTQPTDKIFLDYYVREALLKILKEMIDENSS